MDRSTNALAGAPIGRGRIGGDIDTIKQLITTIEGSTQRIVSHARTLGYFEPPKDAQARPEPVITTLADALQALEHAVNANSGALNVFD